MSNNDDLSSIEQDANSVVIESAKGLQHIFKELLDAIARLRPRREAIRIQISDDAKKGVQANTTPDPKVKNSQDRSQQSTQAPEVGGDRQQASKASQSQGQQPEPKAPDCANAAQLAWNNYSRAIPPGVDGIDTTKIVAQRLAKAGYSRQQIKEVIMRSPYARQLGSQHGISAAGRYAEIVTDYSVQKHQKQVTKGLESSARKQSKSQQAKPAQQASSQPKQIKRSAPTRSPKIAIRRV